MYAYFAKKGITAMQRTIRIKTHDVGERLVGNVKITPEAEQVLRQLCRQSGLSIRYLVSEIVCQGADLVEFVDADHSEEGGGV